MIQDIEMYWRPEEVMDRNVVYMYVKWFRIVPYPFLVQFLPHIYIMIWNRIGSSEINVHPLRI